MLPDRVVTESVPRAFHPSRLADTSIHNWCCWTASHVEFGPYVDARLLTTDSEKRALGFGGESMEWELLNSGEYSRSTGNLLKFGTRM